MGNANTAAIVGEIDDLFDRIALEWDDALDGRRLLDDHGDSALQGVLTSWTAAIERFSGPSSVYTAQARAILKAGWAISYKVVQMHGVLAALRLDYEAGYLRSVEELIHADLFGDFLEMADELQNRGYKDPAAVIARSVLEEHLRKLAERQGLSIAVAGKPKNADTLNADLAKAGVYNKIEQKNVTAWLGHRNDAAHGHYGSYDAVQVALLIQSVREFLTRHPA